MGTYGFMPRATITDDSAASFAIGCRSEHNDIFPASWCFLGLSGANRRLDICFLLVWYVIATDGMSFCSQIIGPTFDLYLEPSIVARMSLIATACRISNFFYSWWKHPLDNPQQLLLDYEWHFYGQ
jgi:hypothetical protein